MYIQKRIKYNTPEEKSLSKTYQAMIQRCYNPNHPNYELYGGRGVTVCDEWKEDNMKYISWAIENGYKIGLQIDKDIKCKELNIEPPVYSPETCSILTRKENSNCTTSNVHLTYKGKTLTISQWCEILGLPFKTLQYRLQLGWSDKKAIETPNGAIKPFAKAIVQMDKNGEFIAEYESAREAERQTKVSYKNISLVVNGKNKTAGGYKWKIKE